MTIKYELEFFSYWHCGSGLSSGADLDLLVIKDQQGMPYVPGKTIKGLLREAMEDINQINHFVNEDLLLKALGEPSKRNDASEDKNEKGECFFRNAELDPVLRDAIIEKKLSKHFYHSLASTEIDDSGVAKENSLRRMEVTIPCVLTGEILNVPKGVEMLMINGLSFIKRLGQNRNRGLGRCVFRVTNESEAIEIKEGGQK